MFDDDTKSTTTSEVELGTTWLLFSDGKRVIALSTDLRVPSAMPGIGEGQESKSNVLSDYDLGGHFGKLTLLEFVFDHRNALVMFEYSASAMLLNLTRPQREEISHIKHSDSTAFAQAPDANRFALLRRDKGQDKISVFERSFTGPPTHQTFDSRTADAQGIMWCPGGQPLLVVYDSPSYAANVLFYTAEGHSLKQLDINSASLSLVTLPMNVDGVGITCLKWINTSFNETTQAVLDGQKQVYVRSLARESMVTQQLARFVHPETIDGSKTFVWQEENGKGLPSSFSSVFLRQNTSFSAISDPEEPSTSSANAIEINTDQTMIATSLQSASKLLWIWKPGQSTPHTVIVFRHSVKNVLWHPILPNVLAVVTTQKRPVVYVWYQPNVGPICGQITLNHEIHPNQLASALSTKFSGSWLPGARHTNGRVPFLFSSATRFEVSFLESVDGEVVFISALRKNRNTIEDDQPSGLDDTINIDTPSKAGPIAKRARFAMEADLRFDENSIIHAQAKYRKW